MAIESKVQKVYWAPTRGRRYLNKWSAVRAEARAIIRKHCPDEKPCRCTPEKCGMCGDPGWSLDIDQPLRYSRYMRLLTNALMVTMK